MGISVHLFTNRPGPTMDTSNLMPMAISAAILYGAYHFIKQPALRAMVLGAAGVIIAKNIPYLKEQLA